MHFSGFSLLGIPLEFVFFCAILAAIAFMPRYAGLAAIGGAAFVTLYKIGFSPFDEGGGFAGLLGHALHEWVNLGNLLALLLGFAMLAKHVENSRAPLALRRYVSDQWSGGVVLLIGIFILASVLDNIAAAMIGGTVARAVFRGKVHVGFLAAIVAASNAGGSGSVIGDTTTTMMWLAGVPPREVFPAYVAAAVALLIVAIPASLQQHAYSPAQKSDGEHHGIDWPSVAVAGFVLCLAVAANLLINLQFSERATLFPFLGLSVWIALLLMTPVRKPEWLALPGALRSALFLLALVWCASLMPVDALPRASWLSTWILGLASAVFDNIPLTALALKQGGYDWGYVAYAVGFGGSVLWFGSSAGVALVNMFPEAKSARTWLTKGWHVAVGYIVGYFAMLGLLGWHPGLH
ncbi:MAG TPA: citrate transporter [Burkholderiaceae bacterium]